MNTETITKYEQAEEYREELSQKGIVLGLESMKCLADFMGNPQNELKFVHIAGTNGKGSVSSFLISILRAAGYRVGSYSSPAVFSQREIIKVNGREISKADYTVGMETIRKAVSKMEAEGRGCPTVFEAETALAFWYFKKKKCDIVVLETGLGGLMDATNIVSTTLAAVITSVSRDHMAMLGDTLEEIAGQKAGIIKNECYVIAPKQKSEVMSVLEKEAKAKNCCLRVADASLAKNIRYGLEKQSFSYEEYKKLEISLAGTYQIENAIVAVETIKALGEAGISVTENQLRKGLKGAAWNGRFTIIGRKPLFIIDGAHNEAAAERLLESVNHYFTNKRIITIIGILKDKEYEKIVALTAPLAQQVITVTTPGNKRAFPAYELAGVVREYNPNVTAADSLQEAVEMSYLLADKDSVIIAYGSLSYLGMLSKIVENRDKIRRDAHGKSEKD